MVMRSHELEIGNAIEQHRILRDAARAEPRIGEIID
jgi:hypothetical protein